MKTVITQYRDLKRWDVGNFISFLDIKSIFKIVILDNILIDLSRERKIKIRDNELYKEPTILSKKNTITARKEDFGKNFRVKNRIKILPNDLVIARLHTQNGLFAFSNDEFVATSTFIPFDFNKELISKEWLFLCLKNYIGNLRKSDSVGRETYTVKDILNLKIPLPPLKIQKQIVNDYYKAKDEAERLRKEADEKEKSIDDYLMEELGIERREEEKKKGAFVVGFKDLERWGVRFNSFEWNLDNLFYSKRYKNISLANLVDINPSYNFSKEDKEKEISFIPMESVSDKQGIITRKEIRNFKDVYNGYTKFKENNIIWAKITPCMQNGKCAIAKNLKNQIGVGSTEFHVFKLKDDSLDINYFWLFLRSKKLRKSAERYFIGSAGQQRVPSEFFEKLRFPLPQLKKQKEIVENIEKIRGEVEKMRGEASELMENAKKQVEDRVLGKVKVK